MALTHSRWWRSLALTGALLMASGGCDSDPVPNQGRATSREIRGQVPLRVGAFRVLRVVAVNAVSRRAVAAATPAADGTFVITGVTVGAAYRLHAVVGNRSIPIVFPKQMGDTAKINVFKVGVVGDFRAMGLAGPIDVGLLREAGADAFDTPPERAPNLQEDYDGDGVVDGRDPDLDGDGTPNAMDTDDDNDGTADRVEYGDLDGDGLTNESDPDLDGDGMANAVDPDNDNDGVPDTMDGTPLGTEGGGAPGDADGDGLPDSEDGTPRGEDLPPVDDDAGAPEDGGEDGGGAEDGGAAEDGGVPLDK